MSYQLALNIVATIKLDQVEILKAKLGTIKQHVNDWDLIPFSRLSNYGIRFYWQQMIVNST